MTPKATCNSNYRLWLQSFAKTVEVAGVAWVLSISVAASADREFNQEYSSCLAKANGITSSLIDCIVAETTRQDIQLNENYKSLRSNLSPKRKKALLDAQRAWMKFRDANCKFYGNPDGGTSALLSADECVLNATADRAKELKLLIPE